MLHFLVLAWVFSSKHLSPIYELQTHKLIDVQTNWYSEGWSHFVFENSYNTDTFILFHYNDELTYLSFHNKIGRFYGSHPTCDHPQNTFLGLPCSYRCEECQCYHRRLQENTRYHKARDIYCCTDIAMMNKCTFLSQMIFLRGYFHSTQILYYLIETIHLITVHF